MAISSSNRMITRSLSKALQQSPSQSVIEETIQPKLRPPKRVRVRRRLSSRGNEPIESSSSNLIVSEVDDEKNLFVPITSFLSVDGFSDKESNILLDQSSNVNESNIESNGCSAKKFKNRSIVLLSDSDEEEKASSPRKVTHQSRRNVFNYTSQDIQAFIKSQEPMTSIEEPISKSFAPFVLDRDPSTGEPTVVVEPKLACFLKEHQLEGIQFMYDNVIGRCHKLDGSSQGGGCILAHAMGLGKTMQVIVLIHSLLSNYKISPFIKKIMIITPKNVIINWALEFDTWFTRAGITKSFKIYELVYMNKFESRLKMLGDWHRDGGVLLVTASAFTHMVVGRTNKNGEIFHFSETRNPLLTNYLLDSGPDILILDEAHLMKNDESLYYWALSYIKTKRRIALTGTPLQNNLLEYYVMVNYVREGFLKSKSEFKTHFIDKIHCGECKDSDPWDVKIMKRAVYVLNTKLQPIVHRRDFSILFDNLPPKYEFVISFQLTEVQKNIYKEYINEYVDFTHARPENLVRRVFADLIIVNLIVNHPKLLQNYYQRKNELFADINGFEEDDNEEVQLPNKNEWFEQFLQNENVDSVELSAKYMTMISILEECYKCGDKVIIFSQSLFNLDLIEDTLAMKAHQAGYKYPHLWEPNKDYYRLDGGVSANERIRLIHAFNDSNNKRSRLFLISSRAGSLGINLIGANRCIIFDCTWNPTTDSQALARIFRFGQTKSCYVYRFIADGTMEAVIYRRQVQKTALLYRVLDRSAVARHYLQRDVRQLYIYQEPDMTNRILPELPSDDVLQNIMFRHDNLIVTVHTHDSLLANTPSECLTWEEREQAWKDYLENKDLIRPLNLPLVTIDEEIGATVSDFEYRKEFEELIDEEEEKKTPMIIDIANVVKQETKPMIIEIPNTEVNGEQLKQELDSKSQFISIGQMPSLQNNPLHREHSPKVSQSPAKSLVKPKHSNNDTKSKKLKISQTTQLIRNNSIPVITIPYDNSNVVIPINNNLSSPGNNNSVPIIISDSFVNNSFVNNVRPSVSNNAKQVITIYEDAHSNSIPMKDSPTKEDIVFLG